MVPITNLQPHRVMEHAAVVTYGSAGTTFVFLGLHVNEIAAIVSACCALVGVGLQAYVAITKIRLMRRSKRWDMDHRHDGLKKGD